MAAVSSCERIQCLLKQLLSRHFVESIAIRLVDRSQLILSLVTNIFSKQNASNGVLFSGFIGSRRQWIRLVNYLLA